jgi:hypothetical protein
MFWWMFSFPASLLKTLTVRRISLQRMVSSLYMKDDKAKIKKKLAFMKKKFGKIKKHQFFTTFKVPWPKDFAPTVIGNFSKRFAGLTLTEMLKKVQIAEKKAALASASASPGSVSQAGSSKSRRSRGPG